MIPRAPRPRGRLVMLLIYVALGVGFVVDVRRPRDGSHLGSSRTSDLLDGREERDHDLRAALFGIEASAEGLSRHRERLTPRQFDQLAAGLAAEVRRLRSLVDGHGTAPGTFDLVDAIDPVVACGRASGLDVRLSVPRGIEVIGRRDTTAQVVLGLLDNARKHAPGSPVDVRASVSPRRGDALRRGSRHGDPWSLARARLRTGGARRARASAPGWACSSLGV